MNDEQLILFDSSLEKAARVRCEMIKMIMEWYGYDMDETKNKIKYRNYLIDNPLVFNNGSGAYGMLGFSGDFPVSSKITEYMVKETAAGLSPATHLDAASLARGKNLAALLVKMGYPPFAAACIAGACMQESGCNPKTPEPTELQKWGWKDAGEGLCGITYWPTKLKCIKVAGVNLPTTPEAYEKGPHISDLGYEDQVKLLAAYLKVMTPAADNILRTSNDPDEVACTSYNFKAGWGRKGSNYFEKMINNVEAYKATHAKHGYKVRNTFVEQMKNVMDIVS